tara:strand:+ start:825 stop:1463 length:639 start_codon:yes stop_codon:yes gene_type:complete
MKFKKGDKVDIKEEGYVGSYRDRWFIDGRIGLIVHSGYDNDAYNYRVYQSGNSGRYWSISGELLEPHKGAKVFKKGDIVRLTEEGVEQAGNWFEDKVYTGLEIHHVGGIECKVWQNDRRENWFVSRSHLEFDVQSDNPKTWKRNKPMMVKNPSGMWVTRHFSHCNKDAVSGRVILSFYTNGYTSFTANTRTNGTKFTRAYTSYREPTKEELA